jgi:hypothetical protein
MIHTQTRQLTNREQHQKTGITILTIHYDYTHSLRFIWHYITHCTGPRMHLYRSFWHTKESTTKKDFREHCHARNIRCIPLTNAGPKWNWKSSYSNTQNPSKKNESFLYGTRRLQVNNLNFFSPNAVESVIIITVDMVNFNSPPYLLSGTVGHLKVVRY